jgi:hypothetical protein
MLVAARRTPVVVRRMRLVFEARRSAQAAAGEAPDSCAATRRGGMSRRPRLTLPLTIGWLHRAGHTRRSSAFPRLGEVGARAPREPVEEEAAEAEVVAEAEAEAVPGPVEV